MSVRMTQDQFDDIYDRCLDTVDSGKVVCIVLKGQDKSDQLQIAQWDIAEWSPAIKGEDHERAYYAALATLTAGDFYGVN